MTILSSCPTWKIYCDDHSLFQLQKKPGDKSVKCSGGSRGGPRPPLLWVKKEEMTEGKKPVGEENQDCAPA